VSDLEPLQGILAATTCAVPGQSLSVGDALACYTSQRTIELGGPADLTVLSRDIVADGVEALEATRVVLTIVDGQVVYAPA
jgi:predicted amidohydrolase YtcJ